MKKSLAGFLSTKIISSLLFLIVLFITSFELSAQSNKIKNQLTDKTITMNASLDQYYRMKINNLNIPFNNRGDIAAVLVDSAGGFFDGHVFLFSGGFVMSGKSNDSIWANGVAGEILLQDYLSGRVNPTPIEPPTGFYVVKKTDPAFSQSWQEWMQAVYLGADFYDGNNDGNYTPFDRNGNAVWDPNEDMPDLLGDETAWCVYNDKVPQAQRRWLSSPQGIEIKQTIFAYSNTSFLSNVFFIRYRIKNMGTVSSSLDSIYFGLWADADIGEAVDDLFGCDTIRSSGFAYNSGPDDWGYVMNPPSLFVNMLAKPHAFIPGKTFIDNNGNEIFEPEIDTPLDSAKISQGPALGIKYIPGAKNLEMKASVFFKSGDPVLDMPSYSWQARHYLQGRTKYGLVVDPCNFSFSHYFNNGVPCSTISKSFWTSGDPVSNTGWIHKYPSDIRFLSSAGPFTISTNEEVEILAAYIVGRGISPLMSISHARAIADDVKWFFDNNFNPYLILVRDELITGNNFKLYQNYPNPFNPSTKISWQSPVSSWQTLKIYDVLGNEITTLVNEEKSAGTYEVDFNASSLPSGVYFYQLVTEGQSVSRKMILLR